MRPLLRVLTSVFIIGIFCAFDAYVVGQMPTATLEPSAEAYRLRGVSLYTAGDAREAIVALKRATELNPNDAEAWDYLGRAYQSFGPVSSAIAAFNRAIQLRPNNVPARERLVSLLFFSGEQSTAQTAANEALAVDPKNAFMHFVIGSLWFRQHQPSVALTEADAAVAIDPAFGDALLLRSHALLDLAAPQADPLNPIPIETRKDYLQKSVRSLEDYAAVGGNEEAAEYWRTQLETLQTMLAEYDLPAAARPVIYKSSAVTQKARIIAKPTPEYTDEARHNWEVGTLRLSGVLEADGKVDRIMVLYGLSAGLTAKAVAAMKKIQFTPAELDGKPVPQYVIIEYNFNIY